MSGLISTDWKKEADALYARTKANWWSTGKKKKANGATILFSAPLTGKGKNK